MKILASLAAALFAFAFSAYAQSPPTPSAAAKAQLASTGKLRLGFTINNANYATQPPGDKPAGIGVDIGEALAAQLGVPLEIVRYNETSAVINDAAAGKWDVALLAVEASRKASMDFSAPYAISKNSYIVPAASPLRDIAEVDTKGVRVAVSNRTAQHAYLSTSIKNASLVEQPNNNASEKELLEGRVDAMAANQSTLEGIMARAPGYRVLPGSYLDVQYSVAVPKGRDAAAAYVDAFMKHMRASGAIAKALERAQLKGVTVP